MTLYIIDIVYILIMLEFFGHLALGAVLSILAGFQVECPLS